MHIDGGSIRGLFGEGGDVEDVGRGINDGSAGDANLRRDLAAPDIGRENGGNGCTGWAGEGAGFPERIGVRAEIGIGVEGVDAVVFGGDKDDIVQAVVGNIARDIDVGHNQRLCIDDAIDRLREELAERRFDIRGSEQGFVGIQAGIGAVVVILEK